MADHTHLIGAHMPTGKGLGAATRSARDIGCTALQVFTSSPQQWKAKAITEGMVADFLAAREDTGIHSVVCHDSYLVNLCAPNPEILAKSVAGLKAELHRCAQYQISWTVSHVGSHMGAGEEAGLALCASNVLEVLAETPDSTHLLSETTAGQGSALFYKFEHIAKLLELTKNPDRLGVCVDTCHIFAAGYDISTPEGYEQTFAEFDRLIGIDKIKAIHCNDSKKALGSKVDRHDHLGQGLIGPTAFECLVRDPRFFKIPILIETPEAETMHQVNVKFLWDHC